MPLKIILLFQLTFLNFVYADELSPLSENKPKSEYHVSNPLKKTEFAVGAEFSQIQLPGLSLTGYGACLSYQFAFSERWAVKPQMSQALGSGSTYLYTSIAGFASYALTGSYYWGHQELKVNGVTAASIQVPRTNVWSVGVGLEQIFLNGAQSVYAAPGMAVFTSYSWQWMNRQMTAGLRVGNYKSGNTEIKGTIINVSLPFDF